MKKMIAGCGTALPTRSIGPRNPLSEPCFAGQVPVAVPELPGPEPVRRVRRRDNEGEGRIEPRRPVRARAALPEGEGPVVGVHRRLEPAQRGPLPVDPLRLVGLRDKAAVAQPEPRLEPQPQGRGVERLDDPEADAAVPVAVVHDTAVRLLAVVEALPSRVELAVEGDLGARGVPEDVARIFRRERDRLLALVVGIENRLGPAMARRRHQRAHGENSCRQPQEELLGPTCSSIGYRWDGAPRDAHV
jgi:hypothetical protein